MYKSDMTLDEIYRLGYVQGLADGAKDERDRLAASIEPSVLDFGVKELGFTPMEMRVALLDRRVQVLYEQFPETIGLKVTVLELDKGLKASFYCNHELGLASLPDVVYHLTKSALQKLGKRNV
jgi:hypothetical protein